MSFTGDPFAPWVDEQIKIRQQAYGSTQRTPEQVQYLFNKNAWLRVASSVNISPEAAEELEVGNISDQVLAQSFVLFGGVVNTYGGLTLPQGGIVPNTEARNTLLQASRYSYGLGSSEYGYTPPPGVDSLKVTHMNKGAIRKYNLRLKAQNLDQFKIIDALYLRLGYYLLIEWGHTHYLDNSGALVNSDFLSPAYNSFFGGGDSNRVLQDLASYRFETEGNYDGGLVMVNNFSWNLQSDGSYEITIDAISTGGLIDSLTINRTGPNVTSMQDENGTSFTTSDFPSNILIENQNKTTLNNFLLLQALAVKEQNWNKIEDVERYKLLGSNDHSAIAVKFEEENKPEQYYTKLKNVLFHIENVSLKLLINNSANTNEVNSAQPLVNIDKNPIMFTHFKQGSTDPLVCLYPSDPSSLLSEIVGEGFKDPANPYKGNLGELHVNIDFIAKTLEAAAEKSSGDINLVSFLTQLLDGINKSMGKINNFSVSYDEVENKLLIVDDTIIPGNTQPPTPLRIFGVKENEGSFVRNVSMTSKITNKLATTIAIGSTASDTSINDSVPLLGKWNVGLTDRIKERSTGTLINNLENNSSKADEKLKEDNDILIAFETDTYNSFKLPSSQDTSRAKSALASLIKHDLAIKTQNGNFPSKGFIPIDLSVEVDGISGVLQYQKFTLTPNVLPPSYENKLDFLIQGIDHTISNNEWVTTYTTLSVVKPANTALNTTDNQDFSSL